MARIRTSDLTIESGLVETVSHKGLHPPEVVELDKLITDEYPLWDEF
jgi:hypothetical protein